MNLKPKEIISLVISVVVIAASIFFLLNTMGGKKDKVGEVKKQAVEEVIKVPTEIDEEVLSRVEKTNDYGTPDLNNIGRVAPDNPFAPID